MWMKYSSRKLLLGTCLGTMWCMIPQISRAVTFTDDPTCIEGMSNTQDSDRPVKDCYCTNPGGREMNIVASITEFGKCPPPPDPDPIPGPPVPPSVDTGGVCYNITSPVLPMTMSVSAYVAGNDNAHQWQNSGVVIDAYNRVILTYSGGAFSTNPETPGNLGPGGAPWTTAGPTYAMPGTYESALIARAGTHSYNVAHRVVISGQKSVGPLEFTANDDRSLTASPGYSDNTGNINVIIDNDPACIASSPPTATASAPAAGYPCTDNTTVSGPVVVPANTTQWVRSGVILDANSRVDATITGSSWYITPSCGPCNPLTGSGSLAAAGYFSTAAPEGQLLAKIGTTIIPVNSSPFTFDGSLYQGEITFSPNDDLYRMYGQGMSDNTGSVTVSFANSASCTTPPPASVPPTTGGVTCTQTSPLPAPIVVNSRDATWKSTGVYVNEYTKLTMTAAGSWFVTPYCGPCGPGGAAIANQSMYVMPSAGEGALLAKVGATGPINVGSSYVFDGTANPYRGEITFTVNDDTPMAYGQGHVDNSGTVTVTFTNDPAHGCDP